MWLHCTPVNHATKFWGLRNQSTFHDATTGLFPSKWGLRNECRNSILISWGKKWWRHEISAVFSGYNFWMGETSLKFYIIQTVCFLDRFKQHPYEQGRIHIGFQHFTEIGQTFQNKYTFNNKKHFPSWNLSNILPEWLRNPGQGPLSS